jgi:hypothetical protein
VQRRHEQQRTVADRRRGHQHHAVTEPAGQSRGEQRAQERSRPGRRERQPDRAARQVQLPGDEDQQRGHHGGERALERCRGETHGPQRGVTGDEPEPLQDLPPHPGGPADPPGDRLAVPDPRDRPERQREEQRVGPGRDRHRQQRHQRPAERRSTDLGRGPAALDRAVAAQQLVAGQHPHERRLVRHVEQHRQRTDGERHHQQHRQAETARDSGHRGARQDQRPAEVGEHHDGPGPPPVHPRAGEQRQEQQRRLPGRPQRAEPARVDVQREDGDQRQDHQARVLAELRGGLPGPEPAEAGVVPQG